MNNTKCKQQVKKKKKLFALSELNLLGWAALVQDMAAGLQVLPPNLGHDMDLPAVALLQLLETSTGVG